MHKSIASLLCLAPLLMGAMSAAQNEKPLAPLSVASGSGGLPTPLRMESSIHQPLPERYIWTEDDSVPPHVGASIVRSWPLGPREDLSFHYFRREFRVGTVPTHATLYVAGPREASIYINGEMVGRYQVRYWRGHDFSLNMRVFSEDVTGFLRSGKNVLAIKAIRGVGIGYGMADRRAMQMNRGELLAVMITPEARGVQAPLLVMSDSGWKGTDASVSPTWDQIGYDDSKWPEVTDFGGIESSVNFFQQNMDTGMYAWPGYDGIAPYLAHFALKAAKVYDVDSGTGSIENAQFLSSAPRGREMEVTLPTEHVSGYDAPQLTLDFGREVTGRIELQSDSDHPAWVTVQYGESEAEAQLEPYLGVDPVYLPPHGTGYGPKSAFRFAIVRFTGGLRTHFRAIRLDGIEYPVKYAGTFTSSDPVLNHIWAVGAYTAQLCMQSYVWDAPKRDRLAYAGDLNVSGKTIDDVFGDRFLMEKTLDELIGPAPVTQYINLIPGYSAFWVMDEREYYLHTGSLQQLEEVHNRLVQLLNYMRTDVNGEGMFSDSTHSWDFVDWSPGMDQYGPESRMATQFEYYAAFRGGAWLLHVLHDEKNAETMTAEAEVMKAAAQRHMLDTGGTFGLRWQPNAYAVLSGIANASQYDSIWGNVLSHVGQTEYDSSVTTPYYTYYVVEAMARMGHRRAALDWIRKYWGGMIQEGATSYWEGYSPSWYKGYLFHASLQGDNLSGFVISLAHGWSSGVTAWLMGQVLGIQPTGGGFAAVNIRPDLLGLRWVKGGEPTPHGVLGVEVNDEKGYVGTIQLPPGVQANLSVPVAKTGAEITVNGEHVAAKSSEGGRRAIVRLDGEGRYVVRSGFNTTAPERME